MTCEWRRIQTFYVYVDFRRFCWLFWIILFFFTKMSRIFGRGRSSQPVTALWELFSIRVALVVFLLLPRIPSPKIREHPQMDWRVRRHAMLYAHWTKLNSQWSAYVEAGTRVIHLADGSVAARECREASLPLCLYGAHLWDDRKLWEFHKTQNIGRSFSINRTNDFDRDW